MAEIKKKQVNKFYSLVKKSVKPIIEILTVVILY